MVLSLVLQRRGTRYPEKVQSRLGEAHLQPPGLGGRAEGKRHGASLNVNWTARG